MTDAALSQQSAEGSLVTRTAGIISDEEVTQVHGFANFGTMTPREVVDDGVRKTAVGYHCGHTQFTILRDHGLITKPRGMSYDTSLTKKGRAYARAMGLFNAQPAPVEAVDALKALIEDWGMRAGADDALLPAAEQPPSIARAMAILAMIEGDGA